MASVSRGGTIRLQVLFYEYVNGPLFDPEDSDDGYPKLTISYAGSLAAGPYLYSLGVGPVVRTTTGSYQYDWNVPSGMSLGSYQATWEGSIHGSTVVGQENFEVILPASVIAGELTILESDYELVFMSGVSPLYLDPESFQIYYPDASLVDITELVYFYSLEVADLIGGATPNSKALEYIQAAVLCALGRIYEYSPSGDETTFTLGDLSVQTRYTTSGGVKNLAQARSWCEIAALLRAEITGSTVNMKAVLKGTRFINPMPARAIRRKDRLHSSYPSGYWDSL